MKEVRVFYDNSGYTLQWLMALNRAKASFAKAGFNIVFDDTLFSNPIGVIQQKIDINRLKNKLKHCRYDIVFLAFHWTSEFCKMNEAVRIELLQQFSKKSQFVVWLDTADSTGTTMFEVLPFVDSYLKKQMLKDVERYCSPIWGGRTHCEFYHNQYGIEDDEIRQEFVLLDKQYIRKLGIAWNVGLGDLFISSRYKRLLNKTGLRRSYDQLDYIPVNDKRKNLDLHFRGSAWSNTAGYQRTLTRQILTDMKDDINIPDVSTKVSHLEYIEELKCTKAIISPFGWGEICTRDFESLVYGATLIKPSMEHLVTFPNWYIANETYIPVEWDFSNFRDIILNMKTVEGDKKMKEIAQKGQGFYRNVRDREDFHDEFFSHIMRETKILCNRTEDFK